MRGCVGIVALLGRGPEGPDLDLGDGIWGYDINSEQLESILSLLSKCTGALAVRCCTTRHDLASV